MYYSKLGSIIALATVFACKPATSANNADSSVANAGAVATSEADLKTCYARATGHAPSGAQFGGATSDYSWVQFYRDEQGREIKSQYQQGELVGAFIKGEINRYTSYGLYSTSWPTKRIFVFLARANGAAFEYAGLNIVTLDATYTARDQNGVVAYASGSQLGMNYAFPLTTVSPGIWQLTACVATDSGYIRGPSIEGVMQTITVAAP